MFVKRGNSIAFYFYFPAVFRCHFLCMDTILLSKAHMQKIYTKNENILTFLCITVFVNICSAILKHTLVKLSLYIKYLLCMCIELIDHYLTIYFCIFKIAPYIFF